MIRDVPRCGLVEDLATEEINYGLFRRGEDALGNLLVDSLPICTSGCSITGA